MNIIAPTARWMLALLVALAVPRPPARATADDAFFASFVGQSQLTSSGATNYTISDHGSGYATPEGQSTLAATETEGLVDATSPCGYALRGIATLADAQGTALHLRFTAHTCGFGSGADATILKAGAFRIAGGTGRFAHATGAGILYKLGRLHASTAIFQFAGTIRGAGTPGGAAHAGVPAVAGARCVLYPSQVACRVPTTNTAQRYTATHCGARAVSGQYVLKDTYDLGFDAAGLAVQWMDARAATGTLSAAASGHSLPFVLADTLALRFAAPGNFAKATTSSAGPGLFFPGKAIAGIPSAQIAHNADGLIMLQASPTLDGVCASLG